MQPREQTAHAEAVMAYYQSGVTHLGREWMIAKLGQGREFQLLKAFQNEGHWCGQINGGRKEATGTKDPVMGKGRPLLNWQPPLPWQRLWTNYSIKLDIRESNFIRVSRRMKR